MFLALTADQRFWDTSQEILFLGEWCKSYSNIVELSKLTYKTLPDIDDIITDQNDKQEYTEKLYEKYLLLISTELNTLHSVNYSEKYWRIVIGPWLKYFIQALYVKYLTIKLAEAEGTVTDTIIPIYDPDKVTPYDLYSFFDWSANSDEYNQYLFGRIIKEMSSFPFHEVSQTFSLKRFESLDLRFAGNINNTGFIYRSICLMNDIYSIWFPLKLNSILLFASYMSNADIIKLCFKLHQFPHAIDRLPDQQYDIHPVSKEMRSKIVLQHSEIDEFDSLLSVLIPEQIPKGIIESFKEISKSLKNIGKNVKAMYCANGKINFRFLMFYANLSEKGAKIIEVQHGGSIGSSLYNREEIIQKERSDLFLSWGWSDSSPKVLPMSTGNKFHFVNQIRNMNNEKGQILLIEYNFEKYPQNIIRTYPEGRYQKYITEQFEFCSSLSKTATSLLNIRLDRRDTGCDVQKRWLDKFPSININSEGKTIYEQLKESRLAISTSNSTTILECFVANIPTILFWDPDIEKIRQSAQKYFDKLHEVGILHYTPQSAAKLVNEICDDPMKWWMQPEIQQAKDEFCYQFARTSDDWMDQLAAVLKSQLALAKKEMKARSKK